MKTFQLSLLMLFFLAFSANAQTWAPLGATWTYEVRHAFSPAIEFRQWVVNRDTVIQGQTCSVIERQGNPVGGMQMLGDPFGKMYTYEDSGVVYLYNPDIGMFTTLYDFNATTGDSWTFQHTPCSLNIEVEQVGVMQINGQSRKTLTLDNPPAANGEFTGVAVEGIGNRNLPNPNLVFSCSSIVTDLDYYAGLRCYEDSIIGLVDFMIASSCTYTTVSRDESLSNGIKMYPNPVSDRVHIQSENSQLVEQIELYSPKGKLLLHQSNEKPIDMGSLSSGIYLLRILTPSGWQSKKLVKN